MLTAVYSTRLVLLTFFGKPKDAHAYDHAHESPLIMTVPLVLLAVLATVGGFFAVDDVGRLFGFVGGIGQLVFEGEAGHEFKLDPLFAATATVMALLGLAIGWIYWHGDAKRAEQAQGWSPELHQLLVRKYYIDELYQGAINNVILGAATVVAWFDKRVVNETGVDGGAQLIGFFGWRLKFLQTGRIPNYVLGMALGVLTLALVAFSKA